MEHADLWLKFLAGAAIVIFAGLRLTRNAEKLASALGWGHAFAGFVILGWATSLPELTISVSAVGTLDSPALSAGNISGSVIFNLGILAALDLYVSRRQIRDATHIAGLTPLALFNLVMLTGILMVALEPDLAAGAAAPLLAIFLLLGYLGATAHGWWQDRKQDDVGAAVRPHPADLEPAPDTPVGKLGPMIVRCLVDGLVILLAGVWLTHLGDAIGAAYNLDDGFVGTLFLATVSSLPELVTGFAAVRLGLHIMAAGSILGSNVFNMGILGLCDLIYLAGDHGSGNLITGAVEAEPGRLERNIAFAIVMTLVALASKRLQARSAEHRPARILGVVSLALYLAAVTTN